MCAAYKTSLNKCKIETKSCVDFSSVYCEKALTIGRLKLIYVIHDGPVYPS